MSQVRSFICFVMALSMLRTILGDRSEVMRKVFTGKEDYPYQCSVIHQKQYVGICSILTNVVVIVSVSNMNQTINPGDKKRFYNDINSLRVFAGTIHMNPAAESAPDAVSKKVESFHVVKNHKQLSAAAILIKPPDDANVNLGNMVSFDVVDVAFNVGFLKTEAFTWSSSVKPMPISLDALNGIDAFIAVQENFNANNALKCRIGAWHVKSARKIFHHVMYIPKETCKEAYCAFSLKACLTFPVADDEPYHLCFKSAYWGEPCAKDTGSALKCKYFGNGNILAILTTSFHCGNDGLPCVYTTMPSVLQAYKSIWGDYQPPKV